MQIVYKPIADLKPYDNNPRRNDMAIVEVANSITAFGFRNPIIVTAGNEIVAGHTRYKAALKLGYSKVPCIVADFLTDEQVKMFRLADNKTHELSTWDDSLLKTELLALEEFYDMSFFGFKQDEPETPKTGDGAVLEYVICPRCKAHVLKTGGKE